MLWDRLVELVKSIVRRLFQVPIEIPGPDGETIMFRRVKSLISKGHQLADKANQKLDQSQLVLDLAKALVEDIQDGFAIRLQVDQDAARQLLSLLAGKPGTIPISIVVDPTWDVLPSRIAGFKGGPYDGKKFVIPDQQTELVLEGNHRYKWNGKEFQYIPVKK